MVSPLVLHMAGNKKMGYGDGAGLLVGIIRQEIN